MIVDDGGDENDDDDDYDGDNDRILWDRSLVTL
jgi:hypothetical protein